MDIRGDRYYTHEEAVLIVMENMGWSRKRAERALKSAIESGKLRVTAVSEGSDQLQ